MSRRSAQHSMFKQYSIVGTYTGTHVPNAQWNVNRTQVLEEACALSEAVKLLTQYRDNLPGWIIKIMENGQELRV